MLVLQIIAAIVLGTLVLISDLKPELLLPPEEHQHVYEITAEEPGVPLFTDAVSFAILPVRVVRCSCGKRAMIGYGEILPC